jgi:cellulose synthase/poly-beta-1,6-N-acetylglucosamine synthase-like glycosyltransferase
MMPVLEAILWVIVAAILLPMAVLVAESLAALLPRRREASAAVARRRCAVVVPAHDEEVGIGRTIMALQKQLGPADRLLVVADNCSDSTAPVARALGALVVERTDRERRGKGFALDFGIRALESDPPEVVIIVDADCLVHEGAAERLARETAATGRPTQAVYILDGPPGANPRAQLSAFAFLFKNLVRPLGLDRLGLPCLLTGTGMAFPWDVLRRADLASGNIVEDMKLGLDLAVAGYPAKLCPQARVSGELPTGRDASVAQRKRWEHGHLQTLFTEVPRLTLAAVRQRRPALAGLALELSVPPLSLLFLLWAVAELGLLGWWAWGGSPLPAAVLGSGALAVLLSIFAAWVKFGRERLPLTSLLAAPFYVLWKVPIYGAFIFRRQLAWVRTERTVASPPAEEPAGRQPLT